MTPEVEKLCGLMEKAAQALLLAESDAERKAGERLLIRARDLARKIAREAILSKPRPGRRPMNFLEREGRPKP